MDFSEKITHNNINSVRNLIANKNSYDIPYYPRVDNIKSVITDMDTFPYPRFYRGQWNSNTPIIFDREAGWHPRFDKFYSPYKEYQEHKPNFCFEAPCSTVYPCYPEYLKKYADKQEMEVMLNRLCVAKSP